MNKLQKIIAIGTALTTIVTMSGLAYFTPAVSAATAEEIQASIDALMAELAKLQNQLADLEGTTTPATYEGIPADFTFTKFLKRGSKGDEVKYLQIVLQTEVGEDVVGKADGIFGKMTDAAVKKFQTANSLVSDGLVGKNTRKALNAKLAAGTTPECTVDADCASDQVCSADNKCVAKTACDCTAWVNDACADGKMKQTRTCTPSACAAETQSIADDTCVVTTGGLTVALASDTPASSVLPLSATNAALLKVKFTAGSDGAANITQLVFKRTGVGNSTDFANLYLYDGETRLTTGRSISSSTNEVSFSSLAIEIPAGSSKTITLSADISTSGTGDSHIFHLEAGKVTTTSVVSGTFPISGSAMSIGAVSVGTLTVTETGTLTNPQVGSQNAEIARFKLTAATEDIDVNRITITHSGTTSASNITNLQVKLVGTDTVLATAASLNSSDQAVIVFDTPFTLTKGNSKSFSIYASLAGKPNDTISFYVDETTDVRATGKTYGFGPAITNTWASGDQSVTLQGGTVTVTYSSVPTVSNVSRGGDDVVFMEFSISSTEDIQIRELDMNFYGDASTIDGGDDAADVVYSNYFTDMKIREKDTKNPKWGPKDINQNTTENTTSYFVTMRYTDTVEIDAGQTKVYEFTADIADSANLNNEAFYAVLVAFGTASTDIDIKSRTTNKQITDIIPTTNITGNAQTVVAASLAITLADSPTSKTYVKGSTAEAAGFKFTAGNGSNVTVSSITLTGYVDGNTAGNLTEGNTSTDDSGATLSNLVESITLYDKDAGTAIPNQKLGAWSSGTRAITNMQWAIPARTSKTLLVKTKIATGSIPAGSADDRFAFDIKTAASHVTVVDASGNSFDATGDAANGGVAANRIVTVTGSGTLTAEAVTTPVTQILYDNLSNVDVAKYAFRATREAWTVQEITLIDSDYATNASDEISSIKISYKNSAGTDETKTSTLSGGSVTFTGMDFYVPADSNDHYLTVKVDLATIERGTEGADTGHYFGIDFDVSATFKAVAVSGTSETTGTDVAATDLAGQTMYVRAAVPTLSKEALTTSVLQVGTQELLKFTVTSTGGTTSFKRVVFQITGTLNAKSLYTDDTTPTTNAIVGFVSGAGNADQSLINTVRLYESSDANTALSISDDAATTNVVEGVYYENSTSNATGAYIAIVLTNEEKVEEGTPKTYILKGNLLARANNDSISVSLISPSTAAVATPDDNDYDTVIGTDDSAGAVTEAVGFTWSDRVGSGTTAHALTTFDWASDYKIKSLPLQQSLSYSSN